MDFKKIIIISSVVLGGLSLELKPIKADTFQVASQEVSTNNIQNDFSKNNIIMLDVARRKMTQRQIENCINNIDSRKFNFVQLHLSDNENFAIKTHVLHNIESKNTLSINQLKQIVRFANNKGIQVIPDIDVPGHDKSIINDLKNANSNWLNHGIVMDDETLDYTNPETINFVKQLYAEILPAFSNQKEKFFVIGCDEVAGNVSHADDFINFINQIDKYLIRKGFNSIIWNDGISNYSLEKLNKDVTISFWEDKAGLATPQQIINHGNNIKNADYHSSYFNTIDLNNYPLREIKSNRLAKENSSKMLALWGSSSPEENQIKNNEIISYIKEVQNKIN